MLKLYLLAKLANYSLYSHRLYIQNRFPDVVSIRSERTFLPKFYFHLFRYKSVAVLSKNFSIRGL